MTRYIIFAAFFSAIVNAQDVPPPPRPTDDGPSLADRMKFVEEKLSSVGPVRYIAYIHDNVAENDGTRKFSGELTNVRASVSACRIDDHWRVTRDNSTLDDKDYLFSLRDVLEVAVKTMDQASKEEETKNGHPEWTIKIDPPVFVIATKQKNGENDFFSYDEALANLIAKAIVHAVELCGGGNKDPF